MTTYTHSRQIPASPAAVFAAMSDPARLAQWWGPAGFTNTFELCEFRTGGAWRFIMHGPDGKNWPNESTFEAIEQDSLMVVRHDSVPHFRLTITLQAADGGTLVGWQQAFDDPKVGESLRHIVEPANEQNLDRLAANVLGA